MRFVFARFLAAQRFRRAGAKLEIGSRSQLKSYSLRPTAGAVLSIGSNSIFTSSVVMERPGARVAIGERTFVGKGHLIAAQSIQIGSDVLVSWNVTIVDHQSHNLEFQKRKDDVPRWLTGEKSWSDVTIAPVKIGDKVWLGFGSSILPGVTIGEGAVVGACSVVTKDVEPWTVVAGNPARFIKHVPGRPDSFAA